MRNTKRIRIVLFVFCFSSLNVFAQVGDWPAYTAGYTYFGTTAINQGIYENYAILQQKSNGTTFLNSPTQIHFRIGNSDKMFLANSGNVGIGNTSPEAKFTISQIGNGWDDGLRINRDASNYLTLTEDVTDVRLKNWGSGGLLFFTSLGQAATILNNGNVGIGTNSPASRLQVDGGHFYLGPLSGTLAGTGRLSVSGQNAEISLSNRTISSFVESPANGERWVIYNEGSSTDGKLRFWSGGDKAVFTKEGKFGIGTMSPDQLLTVNGTIHSKEVKVDLSVPAPDYVFEEEYKLPSLEEIKTYIDQNKHLPEMPSAKDMELNGVQLGQMNMLLLKKMEEMTLYMIELKKHDEEQQKEIDKLMKNR